MKSKITTLLIVLLTALALAAPALAGGWATITLLELPGDLAAGDSTTVRFLVLQHGRTPLDGLQPLVTLSNPLTGENFNIQAEALDGQPGVYQASLAFPSAGIWTWRIQAFGMDQRMPDLQVGAAAAEPAQPAVPPAAVQPAGNLPALGSAALLGSIILLLTLAFLLRKKQGWALALLLLAVVVGGAGLASAASRDAQPAPPPPPAAPPAEAEPGASAARLGADLFVAKGCVACHANSHIDRKYYDFQSEFGPNLTSYTAVPEYLRIWLKDPAAVKPATQMPDLGLKGAEIEALIAFLASNGAQAGAPKTAAAQAPAAAEIPVTATPVIKKTGPFSSCSDLSRSQGLLASFSRERDSYLALVDPSNGLPLCSAPQIELGGSAQVVMSPDRTALAALSSETGDYSNYRLTWVDLPSWQAVDAGVRFTSWSPGMAINPTARQVAVAVARLTDGKEPVLLGYRLSLVDFSLPGYTTDFDLDIAPRLLAYTPDGRYLLIYGARVDYHGGFSTTDAQVRLYNAADLSPAWQAELDGVLEGTHKTGEEAVGDLEAFTQWQPALAFSPDGEKLYIVHADSDRLTTVDLANAEVRTVEIQPKLSLLERLLALAAGEASAKVMKGTTKQVIVSPDGQRLHISGFTGDPHKDEHGGWVFDTRPFGLQVIDLASGRELARLGNGASEISLSPDGKTLFLRGWDENKSWSDVLDAGSLEPLAHLDGQLLYSARSLAGAGLIIASPRGQDTGLFDLLDPLDFKQRGQLRGGTYWITFP